MLQGKSRYAFIKVHLVVVVIFGGDPETLTPEIATALTIDKNVYRNAAIDE
jgi:hypothetical protein